MNAPYSLLTIDAGMMWDYRQLRERGIVSSTSDLADKVKKFGFPPGVRMTPTVRGRRKWRAVEVLVWLDSRNLEGPTTLRFPVIPRPPGRPTGSKTRAK